MAEKGFQLEDDLADALKRASAEQHRSESELVAEALRGYLTEIPRSTQRDLPIPGLGEFDSGDPDFARNCDEILKEAARRGAGF